jgi:hypothetical protein
MYKPQDMDRDPDTSQPSSLKHINNSRYVKVKVTGVIHQLESTAKTNPKTQTTGAIYYNELAI